MKILICRGMSYLAVAAVVILTTGGCGSSGSGGGGVDGGGGSTAVGRFVMVAKAEIKSTVANVAPEYVAPLENALLNLQKIELVPVLRDKLGTPLSATSLYGYSWPGTIQLLDSVWRDWLKDYETARLHRVDILHELFRAVDPTATPLDVNDEAYRITLQTWGLWGSVCDRTPELVRFLEQEFKLKCEFITQEQLRTVTGVFFGSDNSPRFLNERDFQGMSNLESIRGQNLSFVTLPEGIFKNLPRLRVVDFWISALRYLPEKIFQNVPSLQYVNLRCHHLDEIPAGLFQGLNLAGLNLGAGCSNGFKGPVSRDVFAHMTNLEFLNLSATGLSVVPENYLKGLTRLKRVSLRGNPYTSLPENLFQDQKDLEEVFLHNDSLRNVPPGLLKNRPELRLVSIYSPKVTALPTDFFVGLHKDFEAYVGYNLDESNVAVLSQKWPKRIYFQALPFYLDN